MQYFRPLAENCDALARMAVTADLVVGSIAMVGFGADSLIEVISGGAVLWRMNVDHEDPARCRREQIATGIVSWCFVALAIYLAAQSVIHLIHHRKPETSLAGISLACASILVMPLLAARKKKVSKDLDSGAMRADARQTQFSFYLPVLLLFGLAANAAFGWWWADAAAGLAMVRLIGKEGAAYLIKDL
jgi:divalent metal cation (Fe/Co/Zn/Cd) transporter